MAEPSSALGAWASTAPPVPVPSQTVSTGEIEIGRLFGIDPPWRWAADIQLLAVPFPVGLQKEFISPATPLSRPGVNVVYGQNSNRNATYQQQAATLLATPAIPQAGSPGC